MEADGLEGRIATLAVLSALVRGAETPAAAAKDWERSLRARPPSDLDARIRFLTARLGLPEIHPARLGEVWRAAFREGHSPSRRELLDLARRAGETPDEPDEDIGPWRREIFERLKPILSSVRTLDSFTAATPPEVRESHLELQPLLADWPRRILSDKKWAFVEAPLPDMEPLPLEGVWVDLRLVTAEEAAVPVTGEALRDALDLRYEERHWRADPLEFALGRLGSSAILAGPPGSGKTTLLKWIGRHLISNPEGRFLLPLLVPLRTYGIWKRENPEGHLLDFALLQAGIAEARQRELWTNALSYLSGPRGENVLLLLDGWDEVREEDRPAIHRDIEDYGHGFSMLLTSRPSGQPKGLPIHNLYEITELAPESIERLIDRWFEHAGRPDLAAALRAQLDRSLDLRRLARNPFLLTLLCGLALRTERDGNGSLPTSRATLYQRAMELIYRQDDNRTRDERPARKEKWTKTRREQTESLALWLLAEAPEAPRYVFGLEDIAASGTDRDLLDRHLKPSRLLAQWGLEPNVHHFLHATFQEYLAACALARTPAGELRGHLRSHFFSGAWHEVFHFLAGLPGTTAETKPEAFWQQMAELAREPDRFGYLFLRLARFAAEAGLEDGGLFRLGVDLRDGLWAGILRFTLNSLFVDAYVALDPAGLAQRVQRALPEADRRTETLLLQAVGRTAAPEASEVLVDRILHGDLRTARVALNQIEIVRRLDAQGLAQLRSAAASPQTAPGVRRRAIRALGSVHDHASLHHMVQAILDDPANADDAFFALAALGSDEAVDVVSQLIDVSEEPEWGSMVTVCLESIRSPASRDLLLQIIALHPPNAPIVTKALKAIDGMPVHRGQEILIGLLNFEGPAELRAAAASALEGATGAGVADALMRAARDSREAEVRIEALRSLGQRVLPSDSHWLKATIRDDQRGDDERALALGALIVTAQKFKGTTDAIWLSPSAAGEILNLLERPQGEALTAEAARLAFLVGDVAIPPLLALCRSDDVSPHVRRRACESLGKLRARQAVDVLRALLRRAPEVVEDEETLPDPNDNLARYAARALAEIDPALLLREPGLTAANALARWAIETGSLVFEDRVIGPDGRVTAWAPQSGAAGPVETPVALSDRDLHADVKLFVRKIEGDESRLTFELAVRDPRIGPEHDEFGPVTISQSPSVFRMDLMNDLEGLSCDSEEEREISRERLAAKGTTLFRLFPLGLQMWLWMIKDRARTLQLFSEEPHLPWELTRLRPQMEENGPPLFFGPALAMTRWLQGVPSQIDFPLQRIAVVAPRCDDLPSTAAEKADLLSLHLAGVRKVTEIEPRYLAVKAALRSGDFDGWHFIGHAISRAEDPDRWGFPLEGDEPLRPGDLTDVGGFGRTRPWVFLNGCRSGTGGVSLDGMSGWAKRFLEAGAGAFIGTHWSVRDRSAQRFAHTLYARFLRGTPLGELLRDLRRELLDEDPLTALAYVVYAHPWAACRPNF